MEELLWNRTGIGAVPTGSPRSTLRRSIASIPLHAEVTYVSRRSSALRVFPGKNAMWASFFCTLLCRQMIIYSWGVCFLCAVVNSDAIRESWYKVRFCVSVTFVSWGSFLSHCLLNVIVIPWELLRRLLVFVLVPSRQKFLFQHAAVEHTIGKMGVLRSTRWCVLELRSSVIWRSVTFQSVSDVVNERDIFIFRM